MLLTYVTVHANTSADHLPSETIVLKSPNNSYANWKEIARYVTKKEGLIEYIPSDQQIANWSELICIQYFDKSFMKKKSSNSIEDVMELFRETILASYPGNKVTCRLIEKNKSDAIYEWILHKPFKNIPPEHEVARAFFTDTGLYRIGFTQKNKKMSSKDRDRCIKSLRDFVSVVSIEEAKSITQALSILDRVKDSLNLGEAFENWKEVNTYTFENGYTMVIRVPSAFTGGYVDECLEVTTMPNLYESSIDQLWEVEKKNIQSIRKKSPGTIEFSILKRSPDEIVYSFAHPQDLLQVTGVVRTFLSGNGYYSISYKRGLPYKLKPEEIILWKERLERIKISKAFAPNNP
jgi:hypothetical protein